MSKEVAIGPEPRRTEVGDWVEKRKSPSKGGLGGGEDCLGGRGTPVCLAKPGRSPHERTIVFAHGAMGREGSGAT